MSLASLGIDLYQLTTLIAHAQQGRLRDPGPIGMSFFFRKLPKGRNYVVATGLRSILDHCDGLHFTEEELDTIRRHPVLQPVRSSEAAREAIAALERVDGFEGEIDALPEGTLAFAGPAQRLSGDPVVVGGAPLIAYTPLIQVRTSLLLGKLIETPWLSRLNHLSMVASKAARVVSAARIDGRERVVLEFGQRRTHPEAALDAAYAAYLAGCHATSNVAATHRFGIPSAGTMDHFAIQAAEEPGVPVARTERSFFRAFTRLFPHAATLLVDTYDTMRGIRHAVEATDGACTGVRLDSNVTPESVQRARALLRELGAEKVQIFVSDSLDEWRVRDLARAGADGFGVGENITCSPDAATGIGAVGKLVQNQSGKMTMKLSRGSGKATLPGPLSVYRYADHDLLALPGEAVPPGGRSLLVPVWRGRAQIEDLPPLAASRAQVRAQIDALPEHLRALETDHGRPWRMVISDGLFGVVQELLAAMEGNGGDQGADVHKDKDQDQERKR